MGQDIGESMNVILLPSLLAFDPMASVAVDTYRTDPVMAPILWINLNLGKEPVFGLSIYKRDRVVCSHIYPQMSAANCF